MRAIKAQGDPGDYGDHKVTYNTMDNDTLEMTCERAEDELSGYLDGVLDPQLRRRVEAHLASCDRCQEILADFRRNDEMLRALPFIEPPPGMREQFFTSPRYLKLAEARARQRNYTTPLTAALVAAAVLVLTLGGALLFRQGFFANQQANSTGTTTTIGGKPGGTQPLPAGPRLIYERGGALWSAPEHGATLSRILTPAGVQVAGWAVSPDGHTVIYIAAQTGALHTIRSDALNDAAIGSVTNGRAPAFGFWATPNGVAIAHGLVWSPDNTRVAYVAQNGAGVALHVMNATGAADISATPISGGTIGDLVWSADNVYVAYTTNVAAGQSGQSGQSVWAFNVTTTTATRVAAQSDANSAAATVDRLSWQADSSAASLTWSTRAQGVVTGVFRASPTASDSATRLAPRGASYTTADVSADGAWLLANGATISEIAVNANGPHPVATLAHPVALIAWSPSGRLAAVVSDGALSLLVPGKSSRLVTVARGLTAQGPVVWSPDGDALAWQSDEGVVSAPIALDAAGGAKIIAPNVTATSLTWAPDSQSLALQTPVGVSLASPDGAALRPTDSQAANNGRFAWSLAG